MPFGLSGACSIVSRLVSNCLDNCREYTAGYFDDILVQSDDWNSHLSHLNNVFLTIHEAGFTLNRKKCQFGRATVDLLGFEVGMGRREPRQRKVEAILNLPRPNSKKTLSSWVCLASYFQRFLPNFAHIVSVLTDLLRKNVHFHWSEKAETAFLEIKQKMSSSPILTTPHFDLPCLIACDCSNAELDACLFHIIDDIEYSICYISQKINNQQLNYSTIEKECYALLAAVRRFSVYFGSSHVGY